MNQCEQCFYKTIATEEDGWCYMFRSNAFLDFGGECAQYRTDDIVKPNMNHTPIPWAYSGVCDIYSVHTKADGLDNIIADIDYKIDNPLEAHANARLIVQACNSHAELLEALEAITKRFGDVYEHCDDGWGTHIDLEIITDAKLAIAKANA